MRNIILADDLTGANEIAACFARAGFAASVRLPQSLISRSAPQTTYRPRPGHALIFDTETRNLHGYAVRQRLEEVCDAISDDLTPSIYKKIDSSLRGPIGEEIDFLLRRLATNRAIVAPAFPAQGRTTRRGVQYVHGIPASETAAAQDAYHPVRCAHLPSYLEGTTGRRTISLEEEAVVEGPGALASRLEAAFKQAEVLVLDASSDAHLETIAEALSRLSAQPLVVGTAGLAKPYARRMGEVFEPSDANAPPALNAGAGSAGVLIVCGSHHPATDEQVAVLRSRMTPAAFPIGPDPTAGREAAPREGSDLRPLLYHPALPGRVAAALRQGDVMLLAPPVGDTRLKDVSPAQIAQALGSIVKEVFCRQPPSAMVVTGGETAFHLLQALGISEIEIRDEVMEGIPLGVLSHSHLAHSVLAGLPFVTKAGGFGDPNALVQSVAYLHDLDARHHPPRAIPPPAGILR